MIFLKTKITFILLLLVIFIGSYGQNKLSTEDLFKKYLISQNVSIAKEIITSNDNLYSIFCKADLSQSSDKRIAGFSKFIALSPKYGLAMAYNMRGAAYTSIEKTTDAFADFDHSLLLDPMNAYTYYYEAADYMDLKKFDSAIENLSHSIRLDEGFELAYHLRGIAYDDQKKYENALADFTEEIKLDKKNDIAYKVRGFVYNEMGNYTKAIKDWKKAEKLNPDNDKLLDGFIYKTVMKLRNE